MTTCRIIVEPDLIKGCGVCISCCPTHTLGLADKPNRSGCSIAEACLAGSLCWFASGARHLPLAYAADTGVIREAPERIESLFSKTS